MEKKGLGRGLSALIPVAENNSITATADIEVEIESITSNPYQPRKHFDDNKLQDLVNSVKVHGIIQNVKLDCQLFKELCGALHILRHLMFPEGRF